MNADSLNTSFWTMVFLQTLGSVDMPGSGDRKMPAPRAYIAILVTWTGLNILADTGRERPAAIAGWVMVLTGLVVGPFGAKLTGFLNHIADTYGLTPAQEFIAQQQAAHGPGTSGTKLGPLILGNPLGNKP